jgi:hypothetical protein
MLVRQAAEKLVRACVRRCVRTYIIAVIVIVKTYKQ